MQWVNANKLDKKKVSTFTFIRAEYPQDTKLIEGTLTITYWYSGNGISAITQELVDEATEEMEIIDEETPTTKKTKEPTYDDIPAEKDDDNGDYNYEPEERASVPQTGDQSANAVIAIASGVAVLAAGIFFIRKRTQQEQQ